MKKAIGISFVMLLILYLYGLLVMPYIQVMSELLAKMILNQ